ncbi:MAG: colanic acid biosynthesis glycosyltransferase WcaL [Verrucomicrobia bacterium]|nr:MAG: colanic acid biosynthesis glycosyltransferase WcaL [Verrucomicrobiota bacterium]
MLHIYRQITSLRRVRPVVLAQKRENEERFPFQDIRVVKKPAWHFLRRIWFKQIIDRPWQIIADEVCDIERALTESNAQLLHIYFGHVAVLLRPLIRHWPKRTIVSFHGADVLVDMQKPAYRRATEEMLSLVRRVLVRSESLRQPVIDLGCAPEKIEIQRTGIPLADFPLRERHAPENGQWRLLQAGRLIEKKGLETALRAFGKFQREFPASRLTIAGEGPQRERLQSLARDLEIASAVDFPGFVSQEELRQLLYSSHLFLHPSETGRDGNQEGVPNSMLEAMATGLPVFATRHGGIPEAVGHNISGILVEERDYESLGDALIDCAKDSARLLAMGRVAFESVTRNFNQTEQTRRLEEIYLQEIAR